MGLSHTRFPECWAVLRPALAADGSLSLSNLLVKFGNNRAEGSQQENKTRVRRRAGSRIRRHWVLTQGSGRTPRTIHGPPGSPRSPCRTRVAWAEAATPCWRPGGLASHARPEGKRRKTSLLWPSEQTAASALSSLPIGKTDWTLNA